MTQPREDDRQAPAGTGTERGKALPAGRAWLYVVIGGLLEIVWATSFKTGVLGIHTLIAIFASFDLLVRASKVLPIGTVYAVFAGIGAIGTIVVGAVYLNEPFPPLKLTLILLLAAFIVGLKLSEGGGKKGGGA
ncbi:DMT family transporter [Paenibacillus ehimensis]|uniref:DMT family transporter n=1 Tax=Paenibacillus ehimensis TaxID=79264 RepID=UPI000FD90AE9|nr:SMR family transporter [Paenibacillus ehimensis]